MENHMKRLFALLAIAVGLMIGGLAMAQDKPAAPAGPIATPLPANPPAAAAPKPAAAPAAKPAAPKPMTASRKARRAEDARHCLEKATNTDVIKCAEAYL